MCLEATRQSALHNLTKRDVKAKRRGELGRIVAANHIGDVDDRHDSFEQQARRAMSFNGPSAAAHTPRCE
jgi:hypothetical protein